MSVQIHPEILHACAMADYYSSASSLDVDSGEGSTAQHSEDDTDSAYDDDGLSRRTQSITSSVYNYRYENGRRYHAYQDGQYSLPNDDPEQDRLDLQHHLFRLTADGALYLAPIGDNPQNVLDVGTGTGIWAIDFADEHPSAQVLGVDLSPIQPQHVPPNCSFRVDDAEQDWIEEEAKFDLIHSRAMIVALKNWPRFIDQAYQHLKPGGYIELQDLVLPALCDDPEAREKSELLKWLNLVFEAANKMGLNTHAAYKWPELLREAGFVDIHVKWYNWPIGPWAKQKKNKILGRWCLADVDHALGASVAMLTRALGWSIEEVQVLQAQVRNEMKEQKIHTYIPVCFCYARKPGSSAESSLGEVTIVPRTPSPPSKSGSSRPPSEPEKPQSPKDIPMETEPEPEPVAESQDIPTPTQTEKPAETEQPQSPKDVAMEMEPDQPVENQPVEDRAADTRAAENHAVESHPDVPMTEESEVPVESTPEVPASTEPEQHTESTQHIFPSIQVERPLGIPEDIQVPVLEQPAESIQDASTTVEPEGPAPAHIESKQPEQSTEGMHDAPVPAKAEVTPEIKTEIPPAAAASEPQHAENAAEPQAAEEPTKPVESVHHTSTAPEGS